MFGNWAERVPTVPQFRTKKNTLNSGDSARHSKPVVYSAVIGYFDVEAHVHSKGLALGLGFGYSMTEMICNQATS